MQKKQACNRQNYNYEKNRVKHRDSELNKDYTLTIFDIIENILVACKNIIVILLKNGQRKRLVFLSAAIIGIVTIVYILRFISVPNALELIIDGESMGIIRWNQSFTPEYVQSHTVARIEGGLGTYIAVKSEVEVSIVRKNTLSASFVSFDTLVSRAMQYLSYDIYAVGIYINGNLALYMSSAYEANKLFSYIVSRFLHTNADIFNYEIIEDIELFHQFIDKIYVLNFKDALEVFTMASMVLESHIVSLGDSLSLIALRHGISLAQLLAANPGMTEDTIIRIGESILVYRAMPLINVRTYERIHELNYAGQQVAVDIIRINGLYNGRAIAYISDNTKDYED